MMTNLPNALRLGDLRQRIAFAFASVILATSAAIAQDIDEDELRKKGGEWVASRAANEELINTSKLLMAGTRFLADDLDDEEFTSSTPPFNVAASLKYSTEYEWRSRNPGLSSRLQSEFRTVAANLAYDVVAEAADAAELCAEMAAVSKDRETAEVAALLAGEYYQLADEFHNRVRESDSGLAGQRVIRAAAAASRAERFAKRLEP